MFFLFHFISTSFQETDYLVRNRNVSIVCSFTVPLNILPLHSFYYNDDDDDNVTAINSFFVIFLRFCLHCHCRYHMNLTGCVCVCAHSRSEMLSK